MILFRSYCLCMYLQLFWVELVAELDPSWGVNRALELDSTKLVNLSSKLDPSSLPTQNSLTRSWDIELGPSLPLGTEPIQSQYAMVSHIIRWQYTDCDVPADVRRIIHNWRCNRVPGPILGHRNAGMSLFWVKYCVSDGIRSPEWMYIAYIVASSNYSILKCLNNRIWMIQNPHWILNRWGTA